MCSSDFRFPSLLDPSHVDHDAIVPRLRDYLYTRRFEESAVGDLARDILSDYDSCPLSDGGPCRSPEPQNIEDLLEHLTRHCACERAKVAAADAWISYLRWRGDDPRRRYATEVDVTQERSAA